MVVKIILSHAHKGVVYLHDTILSTEGQELQKLALKRRSAEHILPWMRKHLTEESYAAMAHCGDYLAFLEDAERTKRKLEVGFFCRQRLCPGCAWRAAVKSAQCVSAISAKLVEEGRAMIFVTLTVPNVGAGDLRRTIQHLGTSWARLLKRKRYALWADSIRKVEVTYSTKRDDYHPHLHCIAYVPKSYFSRHYVSRAQLLEDWQSVTGQPEITQVDVRRCRDTATSSAILEVSKYSAKASDYSISEEVLDTMYEALHHTRAMTYAGRCKDLRDEYQRGRLKQYEELDTTRYTMRVVYVWQRAADAYTEHARQEYDMDAAELEKLQRDEKRLAQYACEQAKRSSELDWLFRTSWARAILDDDADMEVVE